MKIVVTGANSSVGWSLLSHIAGAHAAEPGEQGGLDAISPMLDAAWGESRPVVAITDTERICGFFAGVEHDGSPILRRPDGSTITVPGITVNRLKELI